MTQHKWHKEIKAWADGYEIEFRYKDRTNNIDGWSQSPPEPTWDSEEWEYRIKPQPKEKKFLYLTRQQYEIVISEYPTAPSGSNYIGKIEVHDD